MANHFALALLLFVATATSAQPFVLEGLIVAVADGDTVTLLDAGDRQHRIRLGGIDAPASEQPFGNVSSQSLRRLAHGQSARAECNKIDRFKRPVCVVRVRDMDVGRLQIERGMAWHSTPFAHEQPAAERTAYAEAEAQARAARSGLWVDPDPVPPWDWRRGQ